MKKTYKATVQPHRYFSGKIMSISPKKYLKWTLQILSSYLGHGSDQNPGNLG